MNYKLLNEANRAEGYSSKFRRTLCDKVLPKDWYRFTGDAGNKMPDFCVAKLRCGAHAPGWLNKSHPSMVDGVIDAKVCFHWGSNCCSWSTDVRVRNCGKFFVYQLQPVPLCSLRYCGNNRQGEVGRVNYKWDKVLIYRHLAAPNFVSSQRDSTQIVNR